MPLYFVEVQFYRLPSVYADLASKAFNYLKHNDPGQEFVGAVLFASRGLEPAQLKPYQALLDAGQIRPFFLDELDLPPDAPVVFPILQLIRQEESQAAEQARVLISRVKSEIADEALRKDLIQLIATVILYKLTNLSRNEVEAMLQVHDIRESRVYQEAVEEGRMEGRMELAIAAIPRLAAMNLSAEQIAFILAMDVDQVRKMATTPDQK